MRFVTYLAAVLLITAWSLAAQRLDSLHPKPSPAQNSAPSAPPPPAAGASETQSPQPAAPPDADAIPHQQLRQAQPAEQHYDPMAAMKDDEIGRFYLRRGNPAGAASRFEEALGFNPEDGEAMFGAGEAEQRLGHLAEARRYFQKYLEVLPDGRRVKSARKHLADVDRRLDAPDNAKSAPARPPSNKASGPAAHGTVHADASVTRR